MKTLAIVTISLCWTSIALAAYKPRFSDLLTPWRHNAVRTSVSPYNYKKKEVRTWGDLKEFLKIGLNHMEQLRSKFLKAAEGWESRDTYGTTVRAAIVRQLACELDHLTATDDSLGLPFNDLRRLADFLAFVPAEQQSEMLKRMKNFGQSRLISRLLLGEYRAGITLHRILKPGALTQKEADRVKLTKLRPEITTIRNAILSRKDGYNRLIEKFPRASDKAVNDKGKSPMGYYGQTSADQCEPQVHPFPFSAGYIPKDLDPEVPQLPQFDANNIYAGDWWDNECLVTQGGDSDRRSQPEASTLQNQELYGGTSGLGHNYHQYDHGAGYTSASQVYAPMDDTPAYCGGQTSAYEVGPQNHPFLFPEPTHPSYFQQDLYTRVDQPSRFDNDYMNGGDSCDNEWALNQGGGSDGAYLPYQLEASTLGYQDFGGGASGVSHGAGHSSVSGDLNLMNPRNQGSDIVQTSVQGMLAHSDVHHTLSKSGTGPQYRHIQK
ncbi:hypothetical protein SeMB42_g06905 [Synchytrium endobioticum]|uniref:Uncharacterized protein n=1 Tax=Synchytrium endobioticum TaxID=286115 RepID=A0A507CDG9_9FUNG|nr:hypothetical protein SeMB42_g06905 [Synchytrium endobioticum]TPX39440.1 hypothetical protein SeLEV6574_g07212 [Synchytrium endobioticum]